MHLRKCMKEPGNDCHQPLEGTIFHEQMFFERKQDTQARRVDSDIYLLTHAIGRLNICGETP